jgi:hypothetical protein
MELYEPETVDMELLDVDKPNFKNIMQKLSYIKPSKPEPCAGPEAITYLMKVFDSQRNLGFFILYELMTNSLALSIIPDHEKPHSVAIVLLRLLPESFITGVQRVILRIMEVNSEFSLKMPLFEDKRRLKLPSFAGMDVYQSHIKNICQDIKTNKAELNITELSIRVPIPYHPEHLIEAAPTADDDAGLHQGRSWLNPKITDFTCEKRVITQALIPQIMKDFVKHYTPQEITNLSTSPLNVINLSLYIEFKSLKERGEAVVSAESPLRYYISPHE